MNQKNTKVLITGGAGSIGVHLGRRLASEGQEVVLADNLFRGKEDEDFQALIALPNVVFMKADLTQRSQWDKLGSGYDYIYQLAGVNGTKLFYEMPHEVLRIGVLTILNSLDWMRETNKSGKILFTSSNEAYAGALKSFNQLPIPTPENVPLVVSDPYNPRWTYAGTKLIGELFYIHFAKEYGLRSVIVRPHNFYGPRTGYDHVIPEFIERIQKRTDPLPILGSDDTRTFCYMDDAIYAMQLVMESEKTDGGTYHIGRSHEDEIAIEALAEKLFEIAGWHPKDVRVEKSPKGSVRRRAPDVSKIKKDVGWEAETSLEDGLRKTLEWYNKHPKENP